MKKTLITLLVLLATACTFQVQVLSTPTPGSTQEALLPFSSSTPAASPEPSATPTALPPVSLTVTVPPTAAPVVKPEISVIQFGPNGTYADIIDSLAAGKSKTYSVRALKGQVMSVSIHQNEEVDWTSMIITVVGKDGARLCDTDCPFWHGALPSTQEYLLTVTALGEAPDYILRVAIDPPGMPTQSFVYENKYRNASLTYSDVFGPVHFPGPQVSRIPPELSLQYIDLLSYVNTNLIEAYFLFGSSTDPQIVSACTQPVSFGGQETIVGETSINGVTFTKSQSIGAAAGNIYEQTYYRGAYKGTCYEITDFVHYGSIGAYTSGTVREFDRTALLQMMDQIRSTLVLK